MVTRYLRLQIWFCLVALACGKEAQSSLIRSTAINAVSAPAHSHPDVNSGPSLDETLAFLENALAAEGGAFLDQGLLHESISPGACEVGTSQFSNITWGLQEGPEMKTEKDGSVKVGYSWQMYKFLAEANGFNLSEIDPESIKSGPGFSFDYLKSHSNSFEEYQDIRHADLTLIVYRTRSEQQRIRFAMIPATFKSGDRVLFDRYTSKGELIFHDQERAERFVTAFKHAVLLCGGKTDAFARTPGVR